MVLFIIPLIVLSSTLFVAPVIPADTPTSSLSKVGEVCTYTTGYFAGRKTQPHVGINELISCHSNLVVDTGLNATRDVIGQGSIFGAFDFIALGNASDATSVTVPAATDTTLTGEYVGSANNGLDRVQGTYATVGGSAGNWSLFTTFTSNGSTTALTTNKTCMFNQSTVAGSTMFACNRFTDVTLDGTSGDQLTVNWTNFVTSG